MKISFRGMFSLAFVLWACNSQLKSDDPDFFFPPGDNDNGDSDDGDSDPPTCAGDSAFVLLDGADTLHPIVELGGEQCLLYGLDATHAKLYRLDTDTDEVTVSAEFATTPTDMVLSISEESLWVSLPAENKVAVLDAHTGVIVDFIATEAPADRLAPGMGPWLFYIDTTEFSELHRINSLNTEDEILTDLDLHGADLDASADGSVIYVGESGLPGSQLFAFSAESGEQVDAYTFDGGFTLPWPDRGIVRSLDNPRIFFAERQFSSVDLKHMTGWYGAHVLATNPSGDIVASRDALFDASTYVRFANRPNPGNFIHFSRDGSWLYEFDAAVHLLRRTSVATVLGTYDLGEAAVPPGVLNQHFFSQLVADPERPVLYGLSTQQNQIVVIDTETLLPIHAERVGSAPTDMVLASDGTTALVATFGATEIAVLDLSDLTKMLQRVMVVPGNPFRMDLSALGFVAYAEQDLYNDMALVDFESGDVVASQRGGAAQPDIAFDSTGRFLFAGEAAVENARLRRFDTENNELLEVDITTASYDYPSRRLFYQGGFVYYAGHKFEADTLNEVGTFDADIVMLSPSGTYAFSRQHMYNTTTLLPITPMPVDSSVITVNPDETLVYQFDNDTGAMFVLEVP